MILHDIPVNDTSVCALFEPSRRFSVGKELAGCFRNFMALQTQHSSETLAPEGRLREQLFGPSKEPRDLAEFFWPHAGRASRGENGSISSHRGHV